MVKLFVTYHFGNKGFVIQLFYRKYVVNSLIFVSLKIKKFYSYRKNKDIKIVQINLKISIRNVLMKIILLFSKIVIYFLKLFKIHNSLILN